MWVTGFPLRISNFFRYAAPGLAPSYSVIRESYLTVIDHGLCGLQGAAQCNNCSLERLPPSKALRAALPALEYLTVHQNRIEELPALDLPEFTTLNAGGNPREAAWKP